LGGAIFWKKSLTAWFSSGIKKPVITELGLQNMKNAFLKSCVGAIFFAACLTTSTAYAGKSTQLELFKKELRAVSAGEVPATAAQLVSQAKRETRATTAENAVSAVFIVRPVALISAVSAIARANPEVAAVAAAQGAALLPKKAAAIASAAGDAAPAQVSQINAAVGQAAPAPEKTTATTVAALPPPTVGPPFTPLVGIPTEIDRTDTTEIPANYSIPDR
jgi:hypothetical protein